MVLYQKHLDDEEIETIVDEDDRHEEIDEDNEIDENNEEILEGEIEDEGHFFI